MESQIVFSSNSNASLLKQKYRILRAKILKILDEKFFHPSRDVTQFDSKMTLIELAFKKMQIEDLQANSISQKKAPKIYDYTLYHPNLKTLKYNFPGKPQKVFKDLEKLSIENLCKYLSPDEIELVCEDPIYFLGRKEYRTNENLNDHRIWSKQLEVVKERRYRETNWKESRENTRKAYLQTLNDEQAERLTLSPLRSARVQNVEDPQEVKERAIRIYSRRIKARNNQMSSMVKIRKVEEEEARKDKEQTWFYKSEGKLERVLEKKKEAFERTMSQKSQHRAETQQKFIIIEKKKQDQNDIQRITQDIEHFIKGQASKQTKSKNLQSKSLKARTFSDFKLRKPFFMSRLEEQDHKFEFSRNASPL